MAIQLNSVKYSSRIFFFKFSNSEDVAMYFIPLLSDLQLKIAFIFFLASTTTNRFVSYNGYIGYKITNGMDY